MRRLALLLIAGASSFSGCPAGRCGRDSTRIEIPPLEVPRRDAGKATGEVRAYPPHAIRADGVGPYLLGQDLKQVMRVLPEGPNLELLQLGGYANWRLARAEGGAIAIGADSANVVQFVSVLKGEVARTSAGVGVGSTGAELEKALGPPDTGKAVVRDRQVWTFANFPTVSFLTDVAADADPETAKVIAVVVARRKVVTAARREGCAAGPNAPLTEVVAAARAGKPTLETPLTAAGCVTGHASEAVVLGGGEVILVGGEPGKLKRLASLPATGDFVGLLDIDGDGREEIVTGSQGVDDGEHSVSMQVHRWDAGKLSTILSERPFAIGAAAAAGAGVVPSEIELVLEVRGDRGELEVGGFYLARRAGTLRLVAPLAPVTLGSKKDKGVRGDAGVSPDAK